MKIKCPACHQSIPAEQIDLSEGLADCRKCEKQIPFEHQMRLRSRPKPKPRLEPAAGFRFQKKGETLFISWHCLRPGIHSFFLVFFLIWDSWWVWYYLDLFNHPDQAFYLKLLFPLLHVLAGVAGTYYFLVALLGQWRLTVTPKALHLRFWPLPIPLSQRIESGQIAQLFVRQHRRFRNSDVLLYDLCIWLKTGFEVPLEIFPQYEQAAWLEQELEQHLGIADRAVQGEGI